MQNRLAGQAFSLFRRQYTTALPFFYPKEIGVATTISFAQQRYRGLLMCLRREFPHILNSLENQHILKPNLSAQQNLEELNKFVITHHASDVHLIQRHIIKTFYSAENVLDISQVVLAAGDVLIAYKDHHLPLLGSISMHPYDLCHEALLVSHASIGRDIVKAKLKETTTATRIRMELDGLAISDDGIVTILLVNPKVVRPFARYVDTSETSGLKRCR